MADPAAAHPPAREALALFTDRYDLFIFDLDGTLADTREDIAASVNHALGRVGAPPLDVDTVTRFVGSGARVLVERVLGPDGGREEVDSALRAFLEHYAAGCTYRTRLYAGVAEALEHLASKGKVMAVLTNKPIQPARKILGALGIERFFASILGGDTVPEKKPDPRGLLSIVERLGRTEERSLFVGDSTIDARTAGAAGVRWAWFRHGFEAEPSRDPPPDHILSSLLELSGDAGG